MAAIRTDLSTLFTGSEVSYNGYIIPPEGLHVRASSVPVMDKANKSRTYDKVSFTADFIVALESEGARNTDLLVADIRRKLTTPARRLVIKGHGFDNIDINGSKADMDNGPRTTSFEWEQLQSHRFAHIVWTVEFNLPGCSNITSLTPGDLMAFNYSISWNFDDATGGLRRRVISGEVEIYVKTIGTSLTYDITKVRDLLIKKFPRIGGPWDRSWDFSLSEDRKTLSFTVSDSEKMLDNFLPEAMLDLQLTQSISSNLDKSAFTEWNWSLSASVLVYKAGTNQSSSISRHKELAWISLGRIIVDRLIKYKDKVYYSAGQEHKVKLLVNSIDMADYVTSNSFDFSISGTIFTTTDVLMEATGFLQPLGGYTSSQQLRDNFISNMGISPLITQAEFVQGFNSEEIIDPCNQIVIQSSSNETSPRLNKPQVYLVQDEKPQPDESWKTYEYSVRLLDYNESMVNVPLSNEQMRVETERKDASDASEPSLVPDINQGLTSDNALTSLVSVFNPVARSYRVVLSGKASRLGYRINPPNLLSYGGMTAVKIGVDEVFEKTTPAGKDINNQEMRTHYLAWRKVYVLIPPDSSKAISSKNPNAPINDKYKTDVPKRFKNRT